MFCFLLCAVLAHRLLCVLFPAVCCVDALAAVFSCCVCVLCWRTGCCVFCFLLCAVLQSGKRQLSLICKQQDLQFRQAMQLSLLAAARGLLAALSFC